MSDLTDLKICKRIAEIIELPYKDGLLKYKGDWINPMLDSMRAKSLCLELIIIYKLNVIPVLNYYSVISHNKKQSYFTSNENINKAICLAVIKSN